MNALNKRGHGGLLLSIKKRRKYNDNAANILDSYKQILVAT